MARNDDEMRREAQRRERSGSPAPDERRLPREDRDRYYPPEDHYDPLAWGGMPYGPYAAMLGGAPRGRRRDWRDRYREGPRDFWERAGDEVASWFGDDDAGLRRAEDHRGRGPRGYRRSDARILEDVNDHLTQDSQVDATEITVEVKDREVSLDGEVASRHEKRRAEDCAEDVIGVEHVQNNLRVRPREPRPAQG